MKFIVIFAVVCLAALSNAVPKFGMLIKLWFSLLDRSGGFYDGESVSRGLGNLKFKALFFAVWNNTTSRAVGTGNGISRVPSSTRKKE